MLFSVKGCILEIRIAFHALAGKEGLFLDKKRNARMPSEGLATDRSAFNSTLHRKCKNGTLVRLYREYANASRMVLANHPASFVPSCILNYKNGTSCVSPEITCGVIKSFDSIIAQDFEKSTIFLASFWKTCKGKVTSFFVLKTLHNVFMLIFS